MHAHIVVVHPEPKSYNAHLAATLQNLDGIATIPFNAMAHWGTDGRITPDAPIYSPFIRRKQDLQLD